MSKEHGPPSPDTAHDKDDHDIDHLEGVPDFLQLAAIEALRAEQADRERSFVDAARKNKTSLDDARAAARAEFGTIIDDYLLGAHVTTDSDEYKAYAPLLRDYSIDRKPVDRWDKGYIDDDGNIQNPLREVVATEIRDKFPVPAPDAKDTDPKPDDKSGDPKPDDKGEDKDKDDTTKPDEGKEDDKDKKEKTDEEKAAEARQERIKELETEIKELQGKKATAYAKRMSISPFTLVIPSQWKKRDALDAAYVEAEEAYLTKLEEYQRMLLEDELAASKGESYVSANQQSADALNARFSAILEQDDALKKAALLEEGGLKAKLLEKYEKLPPKQKLALLVGTGALFLASGIGVAAFGVAGGVLAIAGGVGLAGAKGTKSYLLGQSRIYADKDPNSLKFEVKDPEKSTPEEQLQQALDRLRSQSRKEIKDADKKKKIAIGLGAAAVVGGSGAGHLAHLLAGGEGWFGLVGDAVDKGSEVKAAAPPVDAEHTWNVPQVEVKPPQMEFAPGAANLPPGGGGLAETKDVLGNVPQAQVQEVWNQVVPKLQTLDNGFGRPLVYQMDNGGFGIRMTADGQMPREAMEAIANKYQELYGQMPPGVKMTEAVTTITESHPIPAGIDQPVVTPAEVSQMANVIKMDTISYADIVKPENAAVFDKFVHVQQGLEGTDYAKALGMPPAVWLDHLQPFLLDQLNLNNGQGAAGYVDTFYKGPDNTIHFTGKEIPASVLRDMFNEIPVEIRKTLTPA